METLISQWQPEMHATMETRSTNSKNLGKDEKDLPMENYLTVTATINYIVRKLNLKIKKVINKKTKHFVYKRNIIISIEH